MVRLTAVLEQWTEGQYFTDERCPLAHDDQVGVGYAMHESEYPARDRFLEHLHSPEYRGRALVTVTGVLRNQQARHFRWYGSRFDIVRIESHRPAVEIYRGELETGHDYIAEGVYHARGEVVLSLPLRLPLHHAGRIEWIGLRDTAMIQSLDNSRQEEPRRVTVMFRVTSKEVRAAGQGRWNTMVTCKVMRVE